MTELNAQIESTLHTLCSYWNALNQPQIPELWDGEEDTPFCLPQEMPQPIIGWDALNTYYTNAKERLVRCSMRTWDLNVKLVSEDLAVALYQMHWNGEIKGFNHLFGIDSRVTALFRKRHDQWLICHYVEAPAAPMLHLQKYYAQSVDTDFADA